MSLRYRKKAGADNENQQAGVITADSLMAASDTDLIQPSIRDSRGDLTGYCTDERKTILKYSVIAFVIAFFLTLCLCVLIDSVKRAKFESEVMAWRKKARKIRDADRAKLYDVINKENPFMYHVNDIKCNEGGKNRSIKEYEKMKWTQFISKVTKNNRLLPNLTDMKWHMNNRENIDLPFAGKLYQVGKNYWFNIVCDKDAGCRYVVPGCKWDNPTKSPECPVVRVGFHLFHPLTNFSKLMEGKKLCAYTRYKFTDKAHTIKCDNDDFSLCNTDPMAHTGTQCGMCKGQIRGDRGKRPPLYLSLRSCDYSDQTDKLYVMTREGCTKKTEKTEKPIKNKSRF